jgi:hypothetical protein
MIFFGSGRLLLLPLVLFFVMPLFFYSPLAAVGLIALVVLIAATAGGRRRDLPSPAGVPTLASPNPQDFEDVRRTAEEDVLGLADEIRSLDLDIELPGASAEARAEYQRALDQYALATAALDRSRAPRDLRAVSSAVEEGRFAIASTRAHLEGKAPPERRPPCFFDPRHGPSVRDVVWSPPGGTPRPVPVCAADAVSLEEGNQPHARRVRVGDEEVPYWNAPAHYGPWAGGYFSPFGMLLPGFLMGTAFTVGADTIGPHDEFVGQEQLADDGARSADEA